MHACLCVYVKLQLAVTQIAAIHCFDLYVRLRLWLLLATFFGITCVMRFPV